MKLNILLFFWVSHMLAVTDSEAIRQARLEQNELLAEGHIERAAAFWTEDITVRRGLGTALAGKDTYQAMFSAPSNIVYVREPEFIEVSPDWPLAFESGTWTARRENSVVITGRYSAQWVKRNGYWLIRSEVFVALTCNEDASAWSVLQ